MTRDYDRNLPILFIITLCFVFACGDSVFGQNVLEADEPDLTLGTLEIDGSVTSAEGELTYVMACSPLDSAFGKQFSEADALKRIVSKFPDTRYWSFVVTAFETRDEHQFLFGTLVDDHGRQAKNRIFVLSRDWKCSLEITE